jgi:hypothetical protein
MFRNIGVLTEDFAVNAAVNPDTADAQTRRSRVGAFDQAITELTLGDR